MFQTALRSSGCAKRILVVEDDEVDYQRYKRFLAEDTFESYQLTHVTSAGQGLEQVLVEKYDCVLVDFKLPDASGLEFILQYKHSAVESLPALVLLTGYGDANLAVQIMKEGVQDYLDKGTLSSEMLIRTIRSAMANVEMRDQLAQSNAKLREKALHDPLTSLANRVLFEDRCETALELAKRNDKNLAMLLLDLNDFKQVNDTHGHAVGDHVLKEAAKRLGTCLRGTDTLSRLGGDEFAILLQDVGGVEGAFSVIRRLEETTAYPVEAERLTLPVSISIGMAMFPQDGTHYTDLMHAADAAMYAKKQAQKAQKKVAVNK